ncbi:MAG: hypothetical protein RSD32_08100 [Oscillospiraceae bacterium]
MSHKKSQKNQQNQQNAAPQACNMESGAAQKNQNPNEGHNTKKQSQGVNTKV